MDLRYSGSRRTLVIRDPWRPRQSQRAILSVQLIDSVASPAPRPAPPSQLRPVLPSQSRLVLPSHLRPSPPSQLRPFLSSQMAPSPPRHLGFAPPCSAPPRPSDCAASGHSCADQNSASGFITQNCAQPTDSSRTLYRKICRVLSCPWMVKWQPACNRVQVSLRPLPKSRHASNDPAILVGKLQDQAARLTRLKCRVQKTLEDSVVP